MSKVIMVQGTMSNAGKSLIAAGLCRVFVQDGYRAAPFKSQNMALNSYITEEGLEMGRAQVMQAEACKIKPSAAMNPVLLKPTTDMGSQVIVNGKSIGNMMARDYFKFKKSLLPQIKEAYDTLAAEYDIIVIEGAGSPAEINLKENDIVNMGMAELVDAPVLLVGDIDRGGVFAQLAGTLLLLTDAEKERIKGLVINKFRGDKTILDPGLKMLYDITGKKVAGVVPYARVDIDDEDSLAERLDRKQEIGMIDIAVIRFPRISNFTDMHALEVIEGVSVRYVTRPSELESADLILLPGSKSTIADLKWMRENGIEAAVKKKAATGTAVMGICGGYQMLGQTISDDMGMELRETISGMELLPVETVFQEEKTTTRVSAVVKAGSGIWSSLSDMPVQGYEIHMGSSRLMEGAAAFSLIREEGAIEGKEKSDGCVRDNIAGTYLHGIFDNMQFTEALLRAVLKQKGKEDAALAFRDIKEYKEEQYDALADVIRESMDINYIYGIMGMK